MKNETAFWVNFVKPALHRLPGSLAWKIPAEIRKGTPDVFWAIGHTSPVEGLDAGGRCMIGARSGWLELKYVREWPKRATTGVHVRATPEQLAHLRELTDAGGSGLVLVGIVDHWWLLRPSRVREQPEQAFRRDELDVACLASGPISKTVGAEALRRALVTGL